MSWWPFSLEGRANGGCATGSVPFVAEFPYAVVRLLVAWIGLCRDAGAAQSWGRNRLEDAG